METEETTATCDGCGLQTNSPELLEEQRKSFRFKKVRLCAACRIDSLKYAQRTNWAIFLVPLAFFALLSLQTGSFDAVRHYATFILILIVLSPVSIAIHELGHAIMSRALGWDVMAIILGAGRPLWQGRHGDTLLQFRFIQMGGMVWGSPRKYTSLFPLQAILVFGAGPGVNGIAALIGWHYIQSSPSADAGILTGWGLWVLLNTIHAVANLIPYKSNMFGVTVGSDGSQILQAIIAPDKLRHQFEYGRQLAKFSTLRQLGEHERARDTIEAFVGEHPRDPLGLLNLSAAEIETSNYAESLEQSCRGMELMETGAELDPAMAGSKSMLMPKFLEAGFKCNIASAMLKGKIGDPNEALSFAREAYETIPWEPSVQTVYGYAMAMNGSPDEGLLLMKMNLKKLHDQPKRSRIEINRMIAEVETLRTAESNRI